MSVLPRESTRGPRWYPGEAGFWVFLVADLLAFAVIFVAIVVVRSNDPLAFGEAQGQLDRGLGLLNTMLLLGGSLAVVLAVDAIRREVAGAARFLSAAIGCGVAFFAVKVVEWAAKFADDVTIVTSDFWSLYFMSTGLHLAHVIGGIVVLVIVRRRVLARAASGDFIDGAACYWHMVDLLWLVLFPLLYLLG